MGDPRPFPRWIFAARNRRTGKPISTGGRLVLSALWSFARWWEDDPAPWVFPSTATLARLSGFAERSVWRHLADLVDAGLIAREVRSVTGSGRFEGWTLQRLPELDEPREHAQTLLPIDESELAADVNLTEPSRSPDRAVAANKPAPLTELSGPPDRAVSPPLTELSGKESQEEPQEEPPTIPASPGLEAARREGIERSLLVDDVLAYMRDAVLRVTGKPGGPRDVPTNRKLVLDATKRERATLDDWRAVIDAQAESVRDQPDAWRYLCLSTITRPKNWARLADAPRGAPRRNARHAPSRFEGEPSANELADLFSDYDPEEIPL